MAISFLASLLGLGGLGEKIKAIIEKIQKPVNDIIDKLIDRAAGWGKRMFSNLKNSKLGKKVTSGIAAGKRAYAKGKTYVKGKADAAKGWVTGKAVAAAEKLGLIKRPVGVGKEKHTLKVDLNTGSVSVASVEGSLKNKVDGWVRLARSRATVGGKSLAPEALAEIEQRAASSLQIGDSLAARVAAAKGGAGAEAAARIDQLAAMVTDLIIKIGALPQEKASDRADNLGNIAPHGSQPGGRTKDSDPSRHLESEHVLPVAYISNALEAVGDDERIVRGKPEDKSLHTILMYRSASHLKTFGREAADNVLGNQLKAILETGAPKTTGSSAYAKRIGGLPHEERDRVRSRYEETDDSGAKLADRLKSSLPGKLAAILNARVNETLKAIREDHPPGHAAKSASRWTRRAASHRGSSSSRRKSRGAGCVGDPVEPGTRLVAIIPRGRRAISSNQGPNSLDEHMRPSLRYSRAVAWMTCSMVTRLPFAAARNAAVRATLRMLPPERSNDSARNAGSIDRRCGGIDRGRWRSPQRARTLGVGEWGSRRRRRAGAGRPRRCWRGGSSPGSRRPSKRSMRCRR